MFVHIVCWLNYTSIKRKQTLFVSKNLIVFNLNSFPINNFAVNINKKILILKKYNKTNIIIFSDYQKNKNTMPVI